MIVLTVHEAGEYAIRALREGAAGFLPKSAASIELEQAIQTVMNGEVYISPETSRKTLLEYGKGVTKRDLLATLGPRQREVLRLAHLKRVVERKIFYLSYQEQGYGPRRITCVRSLLKYAYKRILPIGNCFTAKFCADPVEK